ncbi:stage V sporulation protein K [Melghiribacillus thermohalophilus]|uniref:Stage V sporulation protein K n=1 Tax=Melghiribacillus thermohalophilus TaxID=1324956 RepID=A0A4R3NHB3_9BACI|nr:AAA family ATPase [Melghiribacillus thermohalophilus]TCT26682.1 stage V sporulation protein K [Melghiribacillus thermohalophilus]
MDVNAKRKGQINIVLQDQNSVETTKKPSASVGTGFKDRFKIIEETFSSFIGMDDMKDLLKEIYANVMISQKREQAGFKTEPQMLHMLFKGNPGTGKTTVARKISELFYEIKLLSKGHFIEAERADLVGEYIGHTAQKTRDLVKKALGGVLFIDEAYSLARGGEKDFGKEAIDTLVKHMEDHYQDFVLILAGYPEEMDHFLYLNPGLKSRFPIIYHFPDYTIDELIEIAKMITRQKEYRLSKCAIQKIRIHLYQMKREQKLSTSNGRYIRNMIEQAIRRQAFRLVAKNLFRPSDLLYLTEEDFHFTEENRL